jgi:hypothetical protein
MLPERPIHSRTALEKSHFSGSKSRGRNQDLQLALARGRSGRQITKRTGIPHEAVPHPTEPGKFQVRPAESPVAQAIQTTPSKEGFVTSESGKSKRTKGGNATAAERRAVTTLLLSWVTCRIHLLAVLLALYACTEPPPEKPAIRYKTRPRTPQFGSRRRIGCRRTRRCAW